MVCCQHDAKYCRCFMESFEVPATVDTGCGVPGHSVDWKRDPFRDVVLIRHIGRFTLYPGGMYHRLVAERWVTGATEEGSAALLADQMREAREDCHGEVLAAVADEMAQRGAD